jgi:hypothetical protein
MIEALGYPFMQRALVAGLLVGVVSSVLGVFVVLRRSAFFGDAVAHASLAGVAAGVVTGTSPLALAAVVAVGIGLSLHRFERSAHLSLDTILGFILPFFMAIGVLLLSLSPGFQPELLSYLFGSILTVTWEGLAATAGVGALVAVVMVRHSRALVFAAFDPSVADHLPRAPGARSHREHQRGRDHPGERAAGHPGRDRQAARALARPDVRPGAADRARERPRRARRFVSLRLAVGACHRRRRRCRVRVRMGGRQAACIVAPAAEADSEGETP